MAPRQRLSPTPSVDEVSEIRQRPSVRANSTDDGSAPSKSSETATTTASKLEKASETDIAREKHDFFNLYALIFVVASTVIDWDLTLLAKGYGPDRAWSGEYFYVNWATTLIYFLIDLIWVATVPICVKSPGVIIKHHFVAMAYLSGPIIWPEYRWFMGACLSVEINTWFLILRRVVYKRQHKLPSWLVSVVNQSFYVTWIVVRIFVYPLILFEFLCLAVEAVTNSGVYFHWPMIMILVHACLCVLNLKWSYDLFAPMIRGWMGGQKQTKVASGL